MNIDFGDAERARLLELIRSEALLEGDFTLSAGERSSWYLDCRRVSLHPEGSVLAALALRAWIDSEGLEPDCVGGPTMAADPLVSSIVALSHLADRPLPGFLVRKEAKGHGTQRLLEGCHRSGWKAVLVEDTVTSGASLLKAVRASEAEGLEVVGVAALVDREQGGAEALADYRYGSVFRIGEIREPASG